jgi:hypothetical protein
VELVQRRLRGHERSRRPRRQRPAHDHQPALPGTVRRPGGGADLAPILPYRFNARSDRIQEDAADKSTSGFGPNSDVIATPNSRHSSRSDGWRPAWRLARSCLSRRRCRRGYRLPLSAIQVSRPTRIELRPPLLTPWHWCHRRKQASDIASLTSRRSAVTAMTLWRRCGRVDDGLVRLRPRHGD